MGLGIPRLADCASEISPVCLLALLALFLLSFLLTFLSSIVSGFLYPLFVFRSRVVERGRYRLSVSAGPPKGDRGPPATPLTASRFSIHRKCLFHFSFFFVPFLVFCLGKSSSNMLA